MSLFIPESRLAARCRMYTIQKLEYFSLLPLGLLFVAFLATNFLSEPRPEWFAVTWHWLFILFVVTLPLAAILAGVAGTYLANSRYITLPTAADGRMARPQLLIIHVLGVVFLGKEPLAMLVAPGEVYTPLLVIIAVVFLIFWLSSFLSQRAMQKRLDAGWRNEWLVATQIHHLWKAKEAICEALGTALKPEEFLRLMEFLEPRVRSGSNQLPEPERTIAFAKWCEETAQSRPHVLREVYSAVAHQTTSS